METRIIFCIIWLILGIILTLFSKQITELRGTYTGKKGEFTKKERQNRVKILGIGSIIGSIISIIQLMN